LDTIEDRLHLIKGLKKKYDGSIEQCIDKQKNLGEEIDKCENWDHFVSQKQEELMSSAKERVQASKVLSEKRKQSAIKLAKAIESEAKSLGFKSFKFVVKIDKLEESEWDLSGAEDVQFFISPNIGEDPKPLSKIASGGELSRIMLAIKYVLSDKEKGVFTSVFDEVDSGIGGAIAEVVGNKLFEVAKQRQIICITHLPQIASFGDKHFVVDKSVVDGRTEATIEYKDDKERVYELARMLGGSKLSETTIAYAEEMLRNSRSNNRG